jgi:hypothetical protein
MRLQEHLALFHSALHCLFSLMPCHNGGWISVSLRRLVSLCGASAIRFLLVLSVLCVCICHATASTASAARISAMALAQICVVTTLVGSVQ